MVSLAEIGQQSDLRMTTVRATAMKANSQAYAGRMVPIVIGMLLLLLAGWLGYQQEKTPGVQEKSFCHDRPNKKQSNCGNNLKKTQSSPQESQRNEPTALDRLVMKDLKLKNESGRIVYEGDIDLTPTLARIKKGEKFPHRNDGAAFGNRERRLPQKTAGYYKEYVVPTPDVRGPGPQRLVIGEKGEVYYTSNHYASFKRVPVPVELLPEAKPPKEPVK
jgi:ribonuclease T1